MKFLCPSSRQDVATHVFKEVDTFYEFLCPSNRLVVATNLNLPMSLWNGFYALQTGWSLQHTLHPAKPMASRVSMPFKQAGGIQEASAKRQEPSRKAKSF